MPLKYEHICEHIKNNGTQCTISCAKTFCSHHKKLDRTECSEEGCPVKTSSKYGLCSKNSQHCRYKKFYKPYFTDTE